MFSFWQKKITNEYYLIQISCILFGKYSNRGNVGAIYSFHRIVYSLGLKQKKHICILSTILQKYKIMCTMEKSARYFIEFHKRKCRFSRVVAKVKPNLFYLTMACTKWSNVGVTLLFCHGSSYKRYPKVAVPTFMYGVHCML